MVFSIALLSADLTLGKVTIETLSHQTFMELFVASIINRVKVCEREEDPRDITVWRGVSVTDDEVVRINWAFSNLEGTIDLQWLPRTL